jgi:D-alanyl-D-alanine dipeptidase
MMNPAYRKCFRIVLGVALSILLVQHAAGAGNTPDSDKPFRIVPLKSVDELYKAARAATPPHEVGRPRKFDLIELATLDPTIKLDIRYATKNNFMGTPFYKQPRAFLQRPAAEALIRVQHRLKEKGLGLLVFDAYRPWYVTKMFWDGTPPEQHDFVADPSKGSKHNRGCAVDLSLYELKTGKPVPTVSGYDEMSERSQANYSGGTAEARQYRDLLREAMQAEGFTVLPSEWWHFDFKDWDQYPIGNVTFEELSAK